MQAATATRDSQPERTIHRVGSLFTKDLENPKTIGQRITARRLELGLTQEAVAAQCVITQKSDSRTPKGKPKPGWVPRKAGDIIPLSRSAYCMYETDSVAPVLDVLVQIARALRTTPEYIAFGRGAINPVDFVDYSEKVDGFERDDGTIWTIPAPYLKEQYGASPDEVALVSIPDFTPSLSPGDLALVRRGVEPGAGSSGEFVFGRDGELGAAYITRPERAGPYRVYDRSKKAYDEVQPGDLNVLGKVIGKIAQV